MEEEVVVTAPRNRWGNLVEYFNARAKSSDNPLLINGAGACEQEDPAGLFDELFKEITNLLRVGPQDGEVLDVGCGSGEILRRFHEAGYSATGVDIAPAMVELARKSGLKAIHYDGGELPFPDQSFGLVVIYAVFINLPSLESASHLIHEARRVVKDGGAILVGAVPHPQRSPFPTHEARGLWAHLRGLVRRFLNRPPISYFSFHYDFFCRHFDQSGFSSVTFFPCRISRQGWSGKYHVILKR